MSPTQGNSINPRGLCGTTAKNLGCGISIFPGYGNPKEGKKLFRNNCAQCHDKSMTKDMTGPALSGSMKRWSRDTTQLQLYFSNSPAYLDTTTDLRLIELRENWKPTLSHKFQLSMQEVKDIMSYVKGSY